MFTRGARPLLLLAVTRDITNSSLIHPPRNYTADKSKFPIFKAACCLTLLMPKLEHRAVCIRAAAFYGPDHRQILTWLWRTRCPHSADSTHRHFSLKFTKSHKNASKYKAAFSLKILRSFFLSRLLSPFPHSPLFLSQRGAIMGERGSYETCSLA
jgi:hypothetical protein